MERQQTPKSQLYPNRYKKVLLFFHEPELSGLYIFYVPRIQCFSFKESVIEAGGQIKFEGKSLFHFKFEGEGCVVKVHQLALPFLYKH